MQLVLVVEDEYGNAEIIRLLLEAEGYRVVSASNGKEAADLLAGEKPAVILSDYMMPTMNGAELGKWIRSNPALASIPFIFMSGTSQDVVEQAFRDFDAFVPKPFDIGVVLPVIARLAENGRPAPVNTDDVSRSMKQLLKGIDLSSTD
jgi:two-component system phosphate regulon response regulator PhoB